MDDVERFVASWLYDHKPLSEPVDYDEFEDESDSDDDDDSDGEGGSSRRGGHRRNDELAGFRVPGGRYTNGPSYRTWRLPTPVMSCLYRLAGPLVSSLLFGHMICFISMLQQISNNPPLVYVLFQNTRVARKTMCG